MDIEGQNVNILIVKLSAIGDVIHTLPSLAELRRLYPDAHITWVVEEAAADLVQHHPCLDEVLISRRKTWIQNVRAGKIRQPLNEGISFIKSLRQRHYDLVIDFHGLFKSAIIVFLSRGRRKLGYESWQELSGLFLNEKIPEDMDKHAVDRYLDFLRHLGAKTPEVRFVLPSNDEEEKKAQLLMQKHRLEDKKFIAVNPVALWDTKLWSNEKFARLADLIQNRLKLNVVFTGSDKQPLEAITALMTTAGLHLGGETTLICLASIYKKARAVVTTDSGPMHLAAAVGTPVIAVFGPTDPNRTGPYGSRHAVIRSGEDCSPCFLKTCAEKKCMEHITPEQVFAAVEKTVMEEKNGVK